MKKSAPPRLAYQSGFGNTFSSEAVRGALPVGQNSPQRTPKGLYPEVLSGTAFTAPRAENQSTWMYRLRPSAMHAPYRKMSHPTLVSGPFDDAGVSPNRMRWDPFPMPSKPTDFLDGLATLAGSGSPEAQSGIAVHVYRANRSMARALSVERRRRDDAGAAAGAPCDFFRIGKAGSVAGRDLRRPARHAIQASSCPTARRAATPARTTARRSACPSWGRSARRAWRRRATSSPRWRRSRTRAASTRWCRSTWARCGRWSSITRRSTWWPGTATTCPTSTTWRASW